MAGLTGILVLVTLIAYSPSINNTPLFDESYLLAWLSHCLKTGFTAADTSAFVLASPADARDGAVSFGSIFLLITAMLTGTSYQLMRWLQLLVHMANAILIGLAVVLAIGPKNDDSDEDEKFNLMRPDLPTTALAFSSALLFALNPLAPEAASWLFSLPVQWAVFFMLELTVLLLYLLRQNETFDKKYRASTILCCCILGVLASTLTFKTATMFLLPLALCVTSLLLQQPTVSIKSKGFARLSTAIVLVVLALLSVMSNVINVRESSKALPEALERLKIEKIVTEGNVSRPRVSFLEVGPGANLQAIILPVNRNIDPKYNKVLRFLYFFLPLPILFFLVALFTNRRFRMIGLTVTAALLISAALSMPAIDSQNFYGARWLYPVLPLAAIFWGLLCTSPIFVEIKSFDNNKVKIAQYALAAIFLVLLSSFFFQRTFKQNLSYKSNGKLWQVIKEEILKTGRKETSPFIIARGLPQSLSIAPILSPFSPQLLDSQSGLPRTSSLSAGGLKDALKNGKYTSLTVHFEKQWIGFAGTDLKIVDTPFGPELSALKIGKQLAPPLQYYQGAVKFDAGNENLLLESRGKAGPALSMTAYGLSPIKDDFLYVEAKIDFPGQSKEPNNSNMHPLELHWLTNWQGDWDGRDRKVVTVGPAGDGQYHRYYFPLRTLAWTTSGLPTNLMLGFPANSTVALRSIGLGHEPLPTVSAEAVHKQNSNKNYFSHFCFNYPDNDDLGLCAVYGHDNALDVRYDVSAVPGAAAAMIEIGDGSEIFRNENNTLPSSQTPRYNTKDIKGNLKIATKDFVGGIKSVRVFALDADGKVTGHSSDSLKCLIDPNL